MGLAALLISVLAVGGAARWAVVSLGAVAIAAAVFQLRSRRVMTRASPLLVVLGVAAGLTVLQLVPLPPGLLELFNPTAHELVSSGQVLLAGPEAADAWRPLTVDPAATRVELAKLIAYLLLAWIAVRIAATERGRQRLLGAVAATAGVVGMAAIAHELAGAETLYGFYRPEHAAPIVMAPLLNANHLACLMAIGALCAGGLAVHERRVPAYRVLWIAVALICVGVLLATRSRGGVMALAAGVTATAVLLVMQRLREAPGARRGDALRVLIPAAVTVLCTLVLVVYFGGDEVRHELETTSLEELSEPRSKYAAWRSATALVGESPVLGVGRGAFESAFTRVHETSAQVTFSHLENQYLQIVVDWGIAGAAAIAIAVGLALVMIVRRWRTGVLTAAAIGALTTVTVQSVVDFGIELPGIAVPTLMVAATLLYVPLEQVSRAGSRVLAGRAALVAAAVIACVMSALPWSRTLREDHAALRAGPADLEEAEDAFARHPLDYLAAAYIAQRTPQRRVAFINHALRLHPTHPGLHRAVAGLLVSTGRAGQAALEYRLALEGSRDPEPIVTEVLAKLTDPEIIASAFPVESPRWPRIVATLVDAGRHDLALGYITKLADAQPQPNPTIWRRMFALAEQRGDLAAAQRAVAGLARVESSHALAVRLARLQLRLQRFDDAIATLTPLTAPDGGSSRDRVDAHLLLCEIHVARTDWRPARECYVRVLQIPGITFEQGQKVHAQLAKIEEALGNRRRAEFEQSLSRDPKPDPPR